MEYEWISNMIAVLLLALNEILWKFRCFGFYAFRFVLVAREKGFFNIIFMLKLGRIKICVMSFDSVWISILMIVVSCLIIAWTIIDVLIYFPEQYHCLISFPNIEDFTYSILVCVFILMCSIWYIYSRVILYVRQLLKRALPMRTKRGVTVVA